MAWSNGVALRLFNTSASDNRVLREASDKTLCVGIIPIHALVDPST